MDYLKLNYMFFLKLTLEALKFLLFDRLSKALVQLFLVCEHIF